MINPEESLLKVSNFPVLFSFMPLENMRVQVRTSPNQIQTNQIMKIHVIIPSKTLLNLVQLGIGRYIYLCVE